MQQYQGGGPFVGHLPQVAAQVHGDMWPPHAGHIHDASPHHVHGPIQAADAGAAQQGGAQQGVGHQYYGAGPFVGQPPQHVPQADRHIEQFHGDVPYQGHIYSPTGVCYAVLFKFTELKLQHGHRNELVLLQQNGTAEQCVLFNKLFVGGSWWQKRSDESFDIFFHHAGIVALQVAGRYARIAGTQSWARLDNPRVVLLKHTYDV